MMTKFPIVLLLLLPVVGTANAQTIYVIPNADSVMVQCDGQQQRNMSGDAQLTTGQLKSYGCMTAATVRMADHDADLVKCNGGNPNGNGHWLPLTPGQVASIYCVTRTSGSSTPTPTTSATSTPVGTPSPTATAASLTLPHGVPTPPAIPPIPTLKSPVTIRPGANFGGFVVYGNGVTDDTPAIRAALNISDVIVAPATYAIAGNVTIPTGRNISCQSGATFLDTQDKTTRMFQIGYSSSSVGKNSIVGCTLKGTDFVVGSPGSFANYRGGTSGYSELLEIASGWGLHTDGVLIENVTFKDAQGDSVLTYSPCGTAHTGAACNNGTPGTEGPSNIFIVNSTVEHCSQPGIHLNGGQNIVVEGNLSVDCVDDDEVDSSVLQVMKTWWYNNKFTTSYGWLDPQNGAIYGPWHSCTGDDLIPENDSGCWSFNNNIDGTSSHGPSVLLEPSGCPGGGGHYLNESLTNGAQLHTGC